MRAIATTITSQCCELQHHRRYSIVSNNVAIVATLVRLTSVRFSSHVHSTFVRFLSDDLFNFRPSNFRPSKDFRPTPYRLTSYALRLPSYALRLGPYYPTSCPMSSYTLSSCVLSFYALSSCARRPTPCRPTFCYFMPCILTSYAYGLASYHFAILPFHSMFI